MIEQGVLNLLLGSPVPTDAGRAAAQTAFVAAVGVNVYPANATQDLGYPYATIEKVGADHKKQMKGRAGLAATKVPVRIYHQLYGTAEQLSEYARLLLDCYSGPLANGLSCLGIFLQDDSNQWERPVHADEQGGEGGRVASDRPRERDVIHCET